jgi:hypothetical protein
MSYHRLTEPRELWGKRRPAGFICDYDGPAVRFLEPLDPREHDRWIDTGFGCPAARVAGLPATDGRPAARPRRQTSAARRSAGVPSPFGAGMQSG